MITDRHPTVPAWPPPTSTPLEQSDQVIGHTLPAPRPRAFGFGSGWACLDDAGRGGSSVRQIPVLLPTVGDTRKPVPGPETCPRPTSWFPNDVLRHVHYVADHRGCTRS